MALSELIHNIARTCWIHPNASQIVNDVCWYVTGASAVNLPSGFIGLADSKDGVTFSKVSFTIASFEHECQDGDLVDLDMDKSFAWALHVQE